MIEGVLLRAVGSSSYIPRRRGLAGPEPPVPGRFWACLGVGAFANLGAIRRAATGARQGRRE
jgi:hypothetical protein